MLEAAEVQEVRLNEYGHLASIKYTHSIKINIQFLSTLLGLGRHHSTSDM